MCRTDPLRRELSIFIMLAIILHSILVFIYESKREKDFSLKGAIRFLLKIFLFFFILVYFLFLFLLFFYSFQNMMANSLCFQKHFPTEIMEQIIFFSHPKHWFLVSKSYTQLLATSGFKARFIAYLYHTDSTKGLFAISPKLKSLFSIDVLQVLARAHSKCLHACNEYLLYLCAKNVMIVELTFLLDHGADPNAGFIRYIGFDPTRLSFIEQVDDDDTDFGGFRYHSIPIESDDDRDKRSIRDAEDQGPFLGIKNAFICAAKSGQLEIVKLLIDHGLDVSRDTLGLLPWYCDKIGYKNIGRVIYSAAREKGFVFSWWP